MFLIIFILIFLGSKETKGKGKQDLGTKTLKPSNILGDEAIKPIVPPPKEATLGIQSVYILKK